MLSEKPVAAVPDAVRAENPVSKTSLRRFALAFLQEGRWHGGVLLALLSVLLLAAVLLAAGRGAYAIDVPAVLAIILHHLGVPDMSFEAQQAAVLWNIRLPRVLLAVMVGASLGMAGASLQGLFRNPLADPGL